MPVIQSYNYPLLAHVLSPPGDNMWSTRTTFSLVYMVAAFLTKINRPSGVDFSPSWGGQGVLADFESTVLGHWQARHRSFNVATLWGLWRDRQPLLWQHSRFQPCSFWMSSSFTGSVGLRKSFNLVDSVNSSVKSACLSGSWWRSVETSHIWKNTIDGNQCTI